MSKTEHTLQITAGRMRVEFIETPEAVYVNVTGAKPLGFEKEKIRRFLLPFLQAYENDSRRVEISGANCPLTAHVRPVGQDGWIGFTLNRFLGKATT